MSTHRHFDKICVAGLVVALILTILFMNGDKLGIRSVVDEDSEKHSDLQYFTKNDKMADYDISDAIVITLEGNSASFSGNGAYAYDGGVVIANPGVYIIRGSLDDGSITVDTNAGAKVWLYFDNVNVTCSDSAALIVKKADKLFLTLAPGSTNTLRSGTEYNKTAVSEGIDGVIYAKDDLTINGSGTLCVEGGVKHGITANDDMVVTGGTLKVTAVGDAIHVNDSLRMTDCTMQLNAGGDGMQVDNEGGYIYIESGSYTIEAEDEGIAAEGDVTIDGGDIRITVANSQGAHGISAGVTCTINGGTIDIPSCYEGIQANYIDVQGGDITIYPTDDGMNASAGDSSAGNMFGQMPNPGNGGGPGMYKEDSDTESGSDTDTTDTDRTENSQRPDFGEMPDMGDMPESPDMDDMPDFGDDSGAEMPERPDMDDMPDFGDDSGAEMPERPDIDDMPDFGGDRGADMQEKADMDEVSDTTDEDTESPWIHISGGTITIINETARDADGLDSNGDITITGGSVRISLNGSGSNSAIDYGSESGGVLSISGGDVIACGGSSMAESFDASSAQCSIMYNMSAAAEAGTTVELRDSDGNAILSYKVPCSFTSVNMSCTEMQLGETYTIAVGDRTEEVTLEETSVVCGDGQSAMFGGNNAGGMFRGKGAGRAGKSRSTSADSSQ